MRGYLRYNWLSNCIQSVLHNSNQQIHSFKRSDAIVQNQSADFVTVVRWHYDIIVFVFDRTYVPNTFKENLHIHTCISHAHNGNANGSQFGSILHDMSVYPSMFGHENMVYTRKCLLFEWSEKTIWSRF